MSTNYPTRAGVEAAGEMDFSPKPTIAIHAKYGDWPLTVTFTGRLDQLHAAIERLAAAGITPAGPVAAPAAPQRARAKVEPIYQPDGTPCCPVHQRPLKEGKYGLYCTARDDGPESRNGYCGLKFAE